MILISSFKTIEAILNSILYRFYKFNQSMFRCEKKEIFLNSLLETNFSLTLFCLLMKLSTILISSRQFSNT